MKKALLMFFALAATLFAQGDIERILAITQVFSEGQNLPQQRLNSAAPSTLARLA